MSRLKLTLACGYYDRTSALIDGRVPIEGVDLNYLPLRPGETFWRMINHQEFDVSEMSLSSYSILKSKGDQRFIAIPVFPSRTFRHSAIYVGVDSGIQTPRDLVGRRIGVGDYQMTAAVWVRGLLLHEYQVPAEEMTWVAGKPIQDTEAPRKIGLEAIPPGLTLETMLEQGEIDALISVMIPRALNDGNTTLRRLFTDYRRVEADYYRRTGIFPIMHTVVIRSALVQQEPWLAVSLYKAFVQARDTAYRWLYDTDALAVGLPWLIDEIESTRHTLGANFWDYSIDGSRPTLEALVAYLDEQHLTRRKMKVEELFVPTIQKDLNDYLRATGEDRHSG